MPLDAAVVNFLVRRDAVAFWPTEVVDGAFAKLFWLDRWDVNGFVALVGNVGGLFFPDLAEDGLETMEVLVL